MKKTIIIILSVFLIVALVWAFNFYYKNLRGIWPAISKPKADISSVINTTGMPLKLVPGFSISIFTKDLPGARVIAFDKLGNLWVSQTSQGLVTEIDIKDGKAVSATPIFKNLNSPHGLAFDPSDPLMLYVAENDKVSRVRVYGEGGLEKIIDLPGGGEHITRTLGFGPDSRLYVSIGSSCNVCNESNGERAKIFSMNKDGSDFKEFARGLRNAVFFIWNSFTKQMWTTEMGRDFLGDNLPPDEINIIQEGKNYGWPICYGKNVHDADFDKNTYIRNPCMEPFEIPSYIDIPAHSAPLGLAFVPQNINWPKEYWNNLLVAYHGSWNRSVPTGYKVVRYKLDEKGNLLAGENAEDFISGWLANGGSSLGRPVDIIFDTNGAAYISDDKAGVIYKVVYSGK